MPITLQFDTSEELAQFLENLRLGQDFSGALNTSAAAGGEAKSRAKKASASKNNKKAAASKAAAKTKPAAKKGKAAARGAKPGRKPGKLVPIIESAINDMIKKGKPFRSREVTALVMKKAPDLNESSVTTGVSKLLSESPLKWEQIKDAIGRPYKLYKP